MPCGVDVGRDPGPMTHKRPITPAAAGSASAPVLYHVPGPHSIRAGPSASMHARVTPSSDRRIGLEDNSRTRLVTVVLNPLGWYYYFCGGLGPTATPSHTSTGPDPRKARGTVSVHCLSWAVRLLHAELGPDCGHAGCQHQLRAWACVLCAELFVRSLSPSFD